MKVLNESVPLLDEGGWTGRPEGGIAITASWPWGEKGWPDDVGTVC